MIDSVKLMLKSKGDSFMEDIIASMTKVRRESFNTQLDSPEVYGMINNLSIKVDKTKAIIANSLSKEFFGSNQYKFDVSTINQATEYYTDLLKININSAKVLKIDLYNDLYLKYPVTNYLDCFNHIPYLGVFRRFKTTSYSQNNVRGVRIYDKNIESKTSNYYLKNLNILRYEVRLMRNVTNYIKLGKPLYWKNIITNEGFKYLNQVVTKMFDNTVLSNRTSGVEFSNCINYSDFQKTVWADWIKLKGGENKVYNIIKEVRSFDQFKDRKGYSRLRKQIKDVSKLNKTDNDLVGELRKAFHDTIRYYN